MFQVVQWNNAPYFTLHHCIIIYHEHSVCRSNILPNHQHKLFSIRIVMYHALPTSRGMWQLPDEYTEQSTLSYTHWGCGWLLSAAVALGLFELPTDWDSVCRRRTPPPYTTMHKTFITETRKGRSRYKALFTTYVDLHIVLAWVGVEDREICWMPSHEWQKQVKKYHVNHSAD